MRTGSSARSSTRAPRVVSAVRRAGDECEWCASRRRRPLAPHGAMGRRAARGAPPVVVNADRVCVSVYVCLGVDPRRRPPPAAMRARRSLPWLGLLLLAHLMPPGACDVSGGAGSANALPAGGAGGARAAPSFDAGTPRNVTALVGKSAYLGCRVRHLGNRTVSWIRHRDLHILTVGGYTYTSDQRFQATHSPQTDDWTLHIKWAQQRDAGVYECQVSTQPVRSYFVTLHVVDCDEIYQRMFSDQVPSAHILGGPDLHVDMGSTINLTCLIQFSPEPPAYIFWYHEDEVSGRKQVISYDSSRGGVSVVTEKGPATTSYLLVQDAAPADSGRYSCSPSNAEVASVRVHVLNGERPAAMQTGSAGLSNSSRCILALLVACALHARLLRAQLSS